MKTTDLLDWKSFIYGVISIVLLLLILTSFGIVHIGNVPAANNGGSSEYGNIPEKCRPPAGEDINSWKEHLGHHAETQDCLKYFN